MQAFFPLLILNQCSFRHKGASLTTHKWCLKVSPLKAFWHSWNGSYSCKCLLIETKIMLFLKRSNQVSCYYTLNVRIRISMNKCQWEIKPCVKEFVLHDCHSVCIIPKGLWEKWYSSPLWPFHRCRPGIPNSTVTSLRPAKALSSIGTDFQRAGQHRETSMAFLCCAMCTQSPVSSGMCCHQAIKAILAIKANNRDRMNQPDTLLTFQGNHPLPFHSEPGTPFRMLYARQQHAKNAGRMVGLRSETWQMLLWFQLRVWPQKYLKIKEVPPRLE